MAIEAKSGAFFFFYYNAGSYGSPSWVEIPIVKDVKVGLTRDKCDASRRGREFKASVPGQADLSYETELVWKPANAGLAALRTAFLNRTEIEVMALDKSSVTSGAQGPRAICMVEDFTRNEPLGGNAATVSIKVTPTDADNDPSWVTV